MSDVAYSEDGIHNLYGAGQKVNLINKAYFLKTEGSQRGYRI